MSSRTPSKSLKGKVTAGAVLDYMRTQLWPVPLIAVIVAVVLGQLVTNLDRVIEDEVPATLSNLLFGGGPSAARSLMEVIAGSTMTVTSLTFSLTVVTLQLASSQYSPRLLRTFTRDRFVHNTLALFLGTFAFTLSALRAIRDDDDGAAGFVPEIAVTLSFGLGIATVIGLILFLGHLARQLRVETMLSNVHGEATQTIGSNDFPGSQAGESSSPDVPEGAHRIYARTSGFLVQVDGESLLDAALRHSVVIVLHPRPGDFLVKGVPVASIWCAGQRPSDLDEDNTVEAISDDLHAGITIGFERTSMQDVGFGIQQMLDVAVRAMSPSVNDPTTCPCPGPHLRGAG